MASAQSLMWKLPPGTHNLAVGTNLRGSMVGSSGSRRQPDSDASQPSTEYISMRYNFKPPAVANARGVIQQVASSNEYHMQLASETGEQHSFTATASQPKKDVECVIFYDPVTKLLVIERLDCLLTVTHQRGSSAATPLSTFTAHTQSSTEKQQPAPTTISQLQLQLQQQLQQRPLTTRTAPPIPSSRSLPTPPSTSPPDFVSLPAIRNAGFPRKPARVAQAPEEAPATAPVTQSSSAVPGRSTTAHSVSSLAHIALPPLPTSNSSYGSTSTPQSQPASLSEFAIQQRALEAQTTDGRSRDSNSGSASDPDDMYDVGQPTSVNALQLSTSSTSSRKRPREEEDESDPDEEELHFGQQTRQIKRAKTSQSPASGSDATPLAVPNTGYKTTSGVTNSSYTSPFGVRPEAPSLIHGHSPLAQSFSPNESQEPPLPQSQARYVQDEDEEEEEEEEENSDSDSDSTDSEDEVLRPPIQQDIYVYTVPDPNPVVYHNDEEEDSDEEDDFLMQALGESGQGVGRGSGTVATSEYYSGDDDSSDNSDYGEH